MLFKLKSKYTIIIISHRPSTLKDCDKIIELKKGVTLSDLDIYYDKEYEEKNSDGARKKVEQINKDLNKDAPKLDELDEIAD